MSQKKDEKGVLIGKTLGDYELIELMASGGMARIYKGIDRRLDRVAAVKVLIRELMDSDETIADRFKREAKAIARLDHPNIVPVYQSNEQDGYYFMAMKYIEGKDLADEIASLRRSGKFMDVKRALNIMEQVAAALDYAHQFDIIHRDVKPSNVLLDMNDRAILTDFGLALWQSSEKTMGTAFGTPRYISPEQALASEKSVPQSDIYSLAVVLYEILTGDMLFRADTPMQIALSHISEPPPPPRSVNPNIPEPVERELLRALSKNPNERHKTAAEFIGAVKSAYGDSLDEIPVVAPLTGTTTIVFDKDDTFRDSAKKAIQTNEAVKDASKEKKHTPSSKPASKEASKPVSKTVFGTSAAPVLKDSGRNRMLMLGLGVMVAIVVIGGVLLSAGSPNASSDDLDSQATVPAADQIALSGVGSETTTLEPATETPIPLLDGEPVTLTYDDEILVLRNASEASIPVSSLSVARRGTAPNTYNFTGSLSGLRCIVLIQNGREVNFDASDWNCASGSDGRVRSQTSLQGSALFWRTDGENNKFEVSLNGEPVAVCDTVNRSEEASCEFNLPAN